MKLKLLAIDPPLGMPWVKVFFVGDEARVFVGIEDGLWHLSISCPDRYPTWDEIKFARYKLIPDDITMAMLLPPKGDYVNIHPNCFHLWQVKDPHIIEIDRRL